jgi:outer membrane scaffolding protein for murein synthesis (MipA/OmpV family)
MALISFFEQLIHFDTDRPKLLRLRPDGLVMMSLSNMDNRTLPMKTKIEQTIAQTTALSLFSATLAIAPALAFAEDTAPETAEDASVEPTSETAAEVNDNATIEITKNTPEGEIRIELTIDEGETDDDADDEVDVKIYRDGKQLSEEETDAEMEEWEEEIVEGLEDAFKGTPRKGIFALHQDRDGGFLELGFGLHYSDGETMMREGFEGLEFDTELNASLQISGLFYEYYSESGQNGLFGLNFYNNDFIGMDLIIGKEHDAFAEDKEDTLLLPISVRNADWSAGFRSAVYLGPLVVQGQVRREITDYHGGFTASLQSGLGFQIRNLNIHGVVGASYQSEEVVDYYYGVTAAEASTNFAEYNPGEDLTYNAEVGASFPISEDWIIRGQVNYTQYSESIVNSPFWAGDNTEHFSSRLMMMLVL